MKIRSWAPANPPSIPIARLIHALGPSLRRWLSCATTDVKRPGHRATWLVAFANFKGKPRPMRAGNVTSVPPPASALITPPAKPAQARMRIERSMANVPRA